VLYSIELLSNSSGKHILIGKFIKKLSGAKAAGTSAETAKRAAPAETSKGGTKKAPGKSQHSKAHQRSSHGERPKGKAAAPWDISQFQVPVVPDKTRFHDLDLPDTLMHGIADLGFEYCSPIQAQSLPHALNGSDVVGKAQTGTGKTAAFLLAIIEELIRNPIEGERYAGEARSLIIAPTRELVMQIADDARALTKHTDLEVHSLVGGMDYGKQQSRVQNKLVDILVATPGRLLDFCGNRDVFLDHVEIMVIDEADRMLDMGFIPQVRRIIRQTPNRENRQTLLFSATFTPEVRSLTEQWTVDPVEIEIEPDSVATDTVTQHVYLASNDEKYKLLYNLIRSEQVESMIVFANRRDECRRLHEKLVRHSIPAGLLSGEIAQNKRVRTLDDFKSGKLKVLVATDVAGRGIHIDGISHVVNFTLPEEPEDYVHRIGRTGRAGKTGTSISFASEDDSFRLMPIEETLGAAIKCEQPPEALFADMPPMGPRPKGMDTGDKRSSGSRGGRPNDRGRRPSSGRR